MHPIIHIFLAWMGLTPLLLWMYRQENLYAQAYLEQQEAERWEKIDQLGEADKQAPLPWDE